MGGFDLRKWNSNLEEVSEAIPEHHRGSAHPLSFNKEDRVKALGLEWHPQRDMFMFNIHAKTLSTGGPTKRTVASTIASLFDPLGWLQPIMTYEGQVFMQKLWLQKLEWDDKLPPELVYEWQTYLAEMTNLRVIEVPRWIGTTSKDRIELHGFCDASRTAIAAVIYSRIVKHSEEPKARLLTAKTKVTPLAVQTIPRLELNSAVLLAKLMNQVKASVVSWTDTATHYWTDSTTVLSWLDDHPARWKTYVGDQVSEIHASSTPEQWYHLRTHENPVDCATRGPQQS
ncbi:uncharacterized protein LOC119658211 [Hermetia illucens]|uniref:uncharacterized protein LOC119658211 n=1 Tax=Hermetia illucens TaxID=343691 RepID=UPI0018CC5D8C|nr:uncharacterized protein LOC119658211 [Hermetia illucens]